MFDVQALEIELQQMRLQLLEATATQKLPQCLEKLQTAYEHGQLSLGDLCLLENIAQKVNPSTRCAKTDARIADLSILLMNKLSRQDYTTVASIMKLPTFRWAQMQKQKSVLQFILGINHEIVKKIGKPRYEDHWVVSMGDGSRIVRLIERYQDKLVGVEYPADVSQWPAEKKGEDGSCNPDEWAPTVPQEASEALKYVRAKREKNQLSHEMYSEAFRCISDKEIPLLVYVLFPEPSKGFNGHFHLKFYYRLIEIWHENNITCVGFVSDSCSTGLSAGPALMTPTVALIKAGVSYLGLDDEPDYEYFSAYMRPAYKQTPKAAEALVAVWCMLWSGQSAVLSLWA